MIVLDTDYLTFLKYEEAPVAQRIHARMKQRGEVFTTTIVCFEEQMRGWMAYLKKAKTVSEQVVAYEFLGEHLRLFCGVRVLPFDSDAAARYQDLRRQKFRVGSMDLKIAAIVIQNSGTLLTRNRKDFEQILGLRVEDWIRE